MREQRGRLLKGYSKCLDFLHLPEQSLDATEQFKYAWEAQLWRYLASLLPLSPTLPSLAQLVQMQANTPKLRDGIQSCCSLPRRTEKPWLNRARLKFTVLTLRCIQPF